MIPQILNVFNQRLFIWTWKLRQQVIGLEITNIEKLQLHSYRRYKFASRRKNEGRNTAYFIFGCKIWKLVSIYFIEAYFLIILYSSSTEKSVLLKRSENRHSIPYWVFRKPALSYDKVDTMML